MFKSKDYQSPVIALIDFGMSKWSSSDGMAGGTPGYRPPETNETNVWFPRGDMFSLGVTFFQLLANKVPDEKTMAPGIFTEGAQSMEQVIYIVQTRQPPWHLIQGQYPGVMSWLPSMMEKQMQRRPNAPNLLKGTPWFNGQGAAADAIVPETAWIMPEPMNDDDLANIPSMDTTPQAAPQEAAPQVSPRQPYFNPGAIAFASQANVAAAQRNVSPRVIQASPRQPYFNPGAVGFQSARARVLGGGIQ